MKHSPNAGRTRKRAKLGATALIGALALSALSALPAQASSSAPTKSVAAKGSDKQREKATPDIVALAGEHANQEVVWGDCPPPDEDRLQVYNDLMVCADIKVPVDWNNVTDEYWTVKVGHVKNSEVTDPGHKGTIFVNPGGPGGSGLLWGAVMHVRTPELNSSYNYIGFDPRGVGYSSQPDECLLPAGNSDAEVAKHCSGNPENRAISTKQTAYDMDLIRHLLGEEKLSYIGYSYGTWLGSIYAREFPANTGPMLLDSSTDITGPNLEQTWYMQNIARDRQFEERMIPWVARHGDEYGLTTDPEQLKANYYADWEKVNASGFGVLYWFSGLGAFSDNSQYPSAAFSIKMISDDAARNPTGPQVPEDLLLSLLAAAQTTDADVSVDALSSFQTTLDRILTANERKVYDEASDFPPADLNNPDFDPCYQAGWAAWDWSDFDDSTVDWTACDWEVWDHWEELQVEFPGITKEQVVEIMLVTRDFMLEARFKNDALRPVWYDDFENIRCNDGQWDTDTSKWTDQAYIDSVPFSNGLIAIEPPLCSVWTASDTVTPLKANTFPGVFVVQAEMDSQTAYETGLIAGTKAPHSVLTAVDNQGDHGLFPMGTACVDQPIIDYFLSGNLPKKKVTICDGLPLPGDDQVYENWSVLGPNGKPKAGNKKPQSAAVVEADKVAKEMIAQQEADFMILQSMNAG